MFLIDTNALIVLLLGIIDKKLIIKHKRTSIYEVKDYENLSNFIGDFSNLLVLPNVWTEVDNLLNNFTGNQRYEYLIAVKALIEKTSERYFESKKIVPNITFELVGLTDALLIEVAKDCKCLITSDSKLSDLAIANGILVYDMVLKRNERIKIK